MTVDNPQLLNAYAQISRQTYLEPSSGVTPNVPTGSFGTYREIAQEIDGPQGFQARAFFNDQRNELVIGFTGTEDGDDEGFDAPEFLADWVTNLSLAAAGVGLQVPTGRLFIGEANAAVLAEGKFGYDVTYVGHSLGGFLAQASSIGETEGEVVAFNAPGIGGFAGIDLGGAFPEDRYTYVYSDPSTWSLADGAVHSLGVRRSDNLLQVDGAEGHSLEDDITGLGLNQVLDENTVLTPFDEADFIPINEAIATLVTLTGIPLADLIDDDNGDGSDPDMGTNGADDLTGTSGADVIGAMAGNDTVGGEEGNDALYGGDGRDDLDGGAGADTMAGGDGNDTMNGRGGDDILIGGEGRDGLFGGAGADILAGGGGNDTVRGGTGNDTINGSTGFDVLNGQQDDDRLFGFEADDRLFGEGGADVASGGLGDDTVDGGAGNDVLKGDGGADLLRGGDGTDNLDGGVDDDVLVGGSGADVFVFTQGEVATSGGGTQTVGSGQDEITDYAVGQDRLDVGESFDDVQISTVGGNAVVEFAIGQVKLIGVDGGDLTASEFVL